MRGQWARLASLTGFVFAGLLVASFIAGGNTPDTDASVSKVVAYYEKHRSGQIAASYLIAYAVLFALLFAASLRSYLRARGAADGLVALGFAGVIVFAGGATTLAGLNYAAADLPGKIAPASEQTLNVLQNDVFFGLLIGLGLFLFGSGLAIVASGALPKWVGWVGIVIGVVGVTPLGWLSLFAIIAWAPIASAFMYLRYQSEPTRTPLAPTGA
jgi:hypothetical protein